MKRTILSAVLLAACLVGHALASEFGYPADGEAWYFIKVSFSDRDALPKGSWRVRRAAVNGVRARDFLLFQDGQEALGKEIKGGLPFEIKIRHGWEANKVYEIEVELENPKTKKTLSLSQEASSPSLRGYWDPEWKNYLALIVAEENGIARRGFPLEATVGLLASYISSPDEIRVVKAEKDQDDVRYTEIPSQVYDFIRWEDRKILSVEEKDEKTGKPISRYHPTVSLSLAFLADLEPHEKATYLVFYNNQAAAKALYPSDLKVTGAGIGKTIENRFLKATLNKKSGVIYEITEKSSRTRLEHK
ncbi:MAG: hypothetical protein AB1715_12920, partial [Acidobacteriota bacterium]